MYFLVPLKITIFAYHLKGVLAAVSSSSLGLWYQILKSATLMGADFEEAQATSFAEFRQRIKICLREARETIYWYKLIQEVFEGDTDLQSASAPLLKESTELKLIFAAIYNKLPEKSKS